jgi:predicted enzyme related to lactoylglutathione lyase
MTDPTTRLGRPVWVDLSTPDPEAARAFYAGLFGWDFQIAQEPEYGGYGSATVDGKDVAGIGGAQPGAPTAWSLYLLTDDAGVLGERVGSAGGTVIVPSTAIGDVGRFAVFQDPAGAFISAFQPDTMAGFHTGFPGAFGWAELHARGLDPDLAFYREVFGWETKTSSMPDGSTYTELQLDGTSLAGALEMEPGMPAEVPSYWLVYFDVDDAPATFAKALASGGSEVVPPSPMPGGRFAVVRDPQGATFGFADASDGAG